MTVRFDDADARSAASTVPTGHSAVLTRQYGGRAWVAEEAAVPPGNGRVNRALG